MEIAGSMICSHCKAPDYLVQAIDPAESLLSGLEVVWARWWRCLNCRSFFINGGDQRIWRRRADEQLDEFERSLVAHLNCGLFGHLTCMPEAWTRTIRVDADCIMRSEYFGELGPTSRLSTRSESCPLRPVGSA